jgi:hypothetical protein
VLAGAGIGRHGAAPELFHPVVVSQEMEVFRAPKRASAEDATPVLAKALERGEVEPGAAKDAPGIAAKGERECGGAVEAEEGISPELRSGAGIGGATGEEFADVDLEVVEAVWGI